MEGSTAPFVVKTYEMVDDSSTDEIVSWSNTNNSSFVVWNPTEFSRLLLPTYFKHTNFSSFIRQLNTYGFGKIHHERWEFGNEHFVKDQKHLLKNIHRKKPVHSHSTHPKGSLVDPERSAFEEEIEKLSHEKTNIETNISGFKQHMLAAKLHLEYLRQRLDGIENRQKNLLNKLERALQNPTLVEQISRKIESMDLLGLYNKKRRLPQADDFFQSVAENDSNFGMEFGNIFNQDFSNKLRLELSSPPAISNELEGDCDNISCLLTLASSSVQDRISPQILDSQEIGKSVGSRFDVSDKESDGGASSSNRNVVNHEVSNLTSSQGIPAAPVRVNDKFWAQFLSE